MNHAAVKIENETSVWLVPLYFVSRRFGLGEREMTQDAEAKSNLVWNIFDGEATVLDVATGNYFSLNAVATEVWQGLQEKQAPPEIARLLSTKYGIDEATAQADVKELIAELRDAKIWD